MLSFWSLCSRSMMYSSSVGRVGIVVARQQFNCGSTSNFCSLTARLSLRQMWLLILLRTCSQVSSVWCFAMVLGGTETMRLTHIYENQTCERLVHDNLDQQICRAFDGHEKDIGNSAWGEFLRINDVPSTNSRLAASPQGEIERSGTL